MGPLAHLTRPDDSNYETPSGMTSSARSAGRCDVDDVGLAEHVLFCFPSDVRRTARRGVRHVMPTESGTTPCEPRAPDAELAEALWSTIRRAVEVSIAGARRVAVSLGGIDSTGLLAALCELRPAAEVVAYTYDYDSAADVPFARELCRAYGVELRVQPLDGALPDIARGLVIDGLPYWSISGAHELHYQRVLMEDGIDRLLTGVYGDDILGGEVTMLGRSFATHPVRTVRHLRDVVSPYSRPLARRLRSVIAAPLVRRALPLALHEARIRRQYRARAPWLSREVHRLGRDGIAASARGFIPPLDAREWRAEISRRVTRSWGPRAQTVVQGGVSRADPYVENELVAFVSGIPYERLTVGDVHRGLFRRALPSRVPSSVRDRQSKGVAMDDFRRLARAGDASLRPFASVDRLVGRGWVDRARFREAFEGHGASHPVVWAVLSAEAFLRECA